MRNFFNYIFVNALPLLLVIVGWLSLSLLRNDFLVAPVQEEVGAQPFFFLVKGSQVYSHRNASVYKLTFREARLRSDGGMLAWQPEITLFEEAGNDTEPETVDKQEESPPVFLRLSADRMTASSPNNILLREDVKLINPGDGSSIVANNARVRADERSVRFTDSFTLTHDRLTIKGDLLTTKWNAKDVGRVFHGKGSPLRYSILYAGTAAQRLDGTATDLSYKLQPGQLQPGQLQTGQDGQTARNTRLELVGSPLKFTTGGGQQTPQAKKLTGEGRYLLITNENTVLLLGTPALFRDQGGEITARANTIRYALDKQALDLSGNAFLSYGSRQARGDNVFYDIRNDRLRLSGLPVEDEDINNDRPEDERVRILIPKNE